MDGASICRLVVFSGVTVHGVLISLIVFKGFLICRLFNINHVLFCISLIGKGDIRL